MSGDAVSQRRRRSHGSADPAPELFMPYIHFSKCSRDLEARKIFRKNVTLLGTFGGSPLVAPEGGSALPNAKSRLSQCCACIRVPEGSNDSREICK